jgi:8-oxo-dGTP diphosphatase
VTEIRLAAGLLEREGHLLLVASRYPNLPAPLWQLPGGRPRGGELLRQALVREFAEETGLEITVGGLLYVSESFDAAGGAHVLSVTFAVSAEGEARRPTDDAHVVDYAWLPRAQALERITTRVIREPLEAHLKGDPSRYHAYSDAGITIHFADEP